MTLKQILPFGEPILRKISKPVELITPKIIQYLDDMKETLYGSEGRAGLAAPQIGILRRLIVMDCGDGFIELINPEMLHSSGEQIGSEACLSFPGYYGTVKRANEVTIKSLNRLGQEVIIEGSGYLARCIQHEMDHLNGVLFVDHVQGRFLVHESTQQKVDLFKVVQLSDPDRLIIP